MKFVIIESPYAASSNRDIPYHIRFARHCVLDSLQRGEAPFASHLLYTQPYILKDAEPRERRLGIEAGLVIACRADLTAVYTNLGISKGMELGIQHAKDHGRLIEYRILKDWDARQKKLV